MHAPGIQGVDESKLLNSARWLFNYARVRHDQTVGAISDVFEQVRADLDDPPLRILIMEGERYGWSSGLFVESIDREASVAYDEIWFNSTAEINGIKNIPYRAYMWRRARYLPSSFFNSAPW